MMWPLLLFVFVTLVGNAVFYGLLTELVPPSSLVLNFCLISVAGGVLCGEMAVVSLICGLWGRTWFSGYAASTALAVLAASVFVLGITLYDLWKNPWRSSFDRDTLLVLNCPPVVLLSSISIIAIRILWGWRLTRRGNLQPLSAYGITDLVLGTALVACLLMLGRSVAEFRETPLLDYWIPVAIISAALAFTNIAAVVPVLWIMFRVEKRRAPKLLAVVVVNAVAISAIIGAISELSPAPQLPFVAVFWLTALWIVFAFGYLVAALASLRVAGFQLQTRKELDANLSVTQKSNFRRFAVPVGVYLSFGLAHLALIGLMMSRNAYEAELRQRQREFAARGGKMDVESKRSVVSIAFGPGVARDDFLKLREYPDLREISLAGTDAVDQDLPLLTKRTYLGSIDLSGTAITDSGLDSLITSSFYSRSLSIAKTKCTADGIGRQVEYVPFYKLDIGGLSLTDADLAAIADRSNCSVEYLVLSDNPISNAGLLGLKGSKLASALSSLDLTDCKVDENALFLSRYNDLILDGTQVTEAGLAAKLPTLIISETLSFDRTAVTDNILPSIAASRISNLRLGETQITEQGLSAMGSSSLQQLCLNSRKFTGACFKTWKPNLISLDMSHSGVTDEAIVGIVELQVLGTLYLSDTAVSDACLPLLAKSNVHFISLCDTRVTAAGLAKFDWGYKRIGISPNQFTEAELKPLLQQRVNILIQTPTLKR